MLQSEWGWTVVVDLFMSGFGGCLFIVTAAVFMLAGDRFRKAVRIGTWASLATVVIGVCCLLADVGQPLRAMWMPGSFVSFESWMPWGAWSLLAAIILFLLFGLLGEPVVLDRLKLNACIDESPSPKRGVQLARKALVLVGAVVGLFVTTYTGFLLKGSMNIPFWDSLWVPFSFIAASLTAGSATMLMLFALTEADCSSQKPSTVLAILTAVFAALSGICICMLLANMQQAGAAAQTSSGWVMSSPAFIVLMGCLALSLALGIAIGVMSSRSVNIRYVAVCVCVLAVVAGITLRYCIVGGGQHEMLLSIDPSQMAAGATFLFQ